EAPCTPCRSWPPSGGAAAAPERPDREARRRVRGCREWPSAAEERELVLADLELVAVSQAVRFDSAAVDVGPVQRAAVVEVVLTAAPDQDRVVARDRHVIQEDVRDRTATDGHPPGAQREGL